MRWLFVVAIGTGCRFSSGASQAIGDAASDGPTDSIDATDSMPGFCYGAAPVRVCLAAAPTEMITLSSDSQIDTDTSTLCRSDVLTPSDNSLCVIGYTQFMLGGGKTLGASGSRPLVVIATSDVNIMGNIDVASHIGRVPQQTGAAANAAACGAGVDPVGIGGGYGGSFDGSGGLGGGGTGVGGVPNATAPAPTTLRGGCAGSAGANTGGNAGDGGGAVALIANGTVQIDGMVDASGAAGGGATANDRGGGGAGSGGMIVIIANVFAGAGGGRVIAAGGGGGEGSGGLDGRDGGEPSPGNLATGAPGGTGATSGGDGGDGSSTSQINGGGGADGVSIDGGGGGGGGAGVLVIHATTTTFNGMVSPV